MSESKASTSTVKLPASLTLATAPAVAIALRREVMAIEGPVALDASGLKEFDSSFWTVFAELKRETKKTLVVNNLPRQLQALGQVYGIWGSAP